MGDEAGMTRLFNLGASGQAPPVASVPETPRTRHFAHFYGLQPLESDGPVALVHGNCQAESLRIVLDGPGLATVRIPPVHELTARDVPHLHAWLARAGTLVTQPVRGGYHDLPLGGQELAARLPPGARVVRVPVIRFAGLYPTHAIIRPPGNEGLAPPVVPYHDLGVLAEAAGLGPLPPLDVGQVRAVAAHALDELRARELAHGTEIVSDLFAAPSFAQMRTLNHPGNVVWLALAARVRARLGLPEHDGDPGRPLLDRLHGPRDPAVLAALGLDGEPRDHWIVDGQRVPVDAVREAHLAWYAERPGVVAAGLRRHGTALRLLGAAGALAR